MPGMSVNQKVGVLVIREASAALVSQSNARILTGDSPVDIVSVIGGAERMLKRPQLFQKILEIAMEKHNIGKLVVEAPWCTTADTTIANFWYQQFDGVRTFARELGFTGTCGFINHTDVQKSHLHRPPRDGKVVLTCIDPRFWRRHLGFLAAPMTHHFGLAGGSKAALHELSRQDVIDDLVFLRHIAGIQEVEIIDHEQCAMFNRAATEGDDIRAHKHTLNEARKVIQEQVGLPVTVLRLIGLQGNEVRL